jgi:hypothetical protein
MVVQSQFVFWINLAKQKHSRDFSVTWHSCTVYFQPVLVKKFNLRITVIYKNLMAEGKWITVIYLFLRRSYSNISTNQKAYSDLSVICTFGSALKNKWWLPSKKHSFNTWLWFDLLYQTKRLNSSYNLCVWWTDNISILTWIHW